MAADLFYIVFSLGLVFVLTQDNTRCDMNNRYTSCPSGYCCVRDQFLATYLYCKRIPLTGHHCITVSSAAECACPSNLTCKANIDTPTFTSVYGTCQEAGDATTTTPKKDSDSNKDIS